MVLHDVMHLFAASCSQDGYNDGSFRSLLAKHIRNYILYPFHMVRLQVLDVSQQITKSLWPALICSIFRIVGMAGIGQGLVLVLLCGLCTFLTTISLSAIATNGAMKVILFFYYITLIFFE